MNIYIPLKLGDMVPVDVLHSVHDEYEVVINEKAPDPNKTLNRNIADNKLECIMKGIESGEEFFGMMDADMVIKKPSIFNELTDALRVLPSWGALAINTHPGKFIDHVCSRVIVFRSEAAKAIQMTDFEKHEIEDICIAVEMRQAGWNLGYYRLHETGFAHHIGENRVAA